MVMASSLHSRRDLYRLRSQLSGGSEEPECSGWHDSFKASYDKIYSEIIRCSQPYNTVGITDSFFRSKVKALEARHHHIRRGNT